MNTDNHAIAVEMLMQGFQPKAIAERLHLSRKTVYKLLKRETPSYIPTDRISSTWKGARTTIVKLLTSLGIEGRELAEWFNCDDGTISHYKHSEPGGNPTIKIELLHDTEVSNGELIKAGGYYVGAAGKPGIVCLRSVTGNTLYFVTGADLQHDIRILELSGVANGR